ncbi:GroES-like protein [Microthyrium microscopicum]|uniref:GroES-like protein n=1 Tax=Microthyrium microscopicum TaxID=703497 RepID=A0A6A6UFB8_9PEZI|nr:GroES-like protein [Microthyrium microscopicum]
MKGLILNAEEKTARIQDIPQPKPAKGEILVKVSAIALNPIDPIYSQNPLGKTGRTVGSDFSGTVEAFGDDVSSMSQLKLGDKVAGFLQGACSVNDRPGAFAEYLIIPYDLVWRIPDNISLEEAASFNLAGLTAAQAIYYRLGLPTPFDSPVEQSVPETETINVLIYGASSSVGLWAAQLVNHVNLGAGKKIRLFGTASKARFPLLQAAPYSYDHLVDYRDVSWPAEIKKLTGDEGIHYAYDCISEGNSVSNIHSTLNSKVGKMAIVRSRAAKAWTAGDLSPEPIYGAVWEGLGVEVEYFAFSIPESPKAREFAVAFYRWLEEGKLKANPVRLMPGGLERIVEDGYVLLGPGSMSLRDQSRTEEWMKPVSAEKLVYRIDG